MPETVKIVDPILLKHNVKNLGDLKQRSDAHKFIQICSEIVTQMIDALLDGPERKLPKNVLESIENDLLTVTRAIVILRKTPIGNIYKLSELEPLIDIARGEISSAAEKYKENVRITYIQQCRRELEKVQEKIEEFSAVKIPPSRD
jgi:hypothetical protein